MIIHSLCVNLTMIKLTPRLQLVAGFVEPCENYVDIGTDHAYLPVYLIQCGRVVRALACDINQGPLDNAKNTIQKYGLESCIMPRLSNGLQGVSACEADTISIAGMGGQMISEIICSAPWLKDRQKRLVLQPMTHFEDVRRTLCENGFEIVKEATAQEGKRIYIALYAAYTGCIKQYAPWYYYTGSLIHSSVASDRAFCSKIIKRLQAKEIALQNAGNPCLETAQLLEALKSEQCKRDL